MNNILKRAIYLLTVLVGISCTPIVTDQTEFALYYFDVGNMMPGEVINLTPSYKGVPPTDFSIYSISHNGKIYYNPKLDGVLTESSQFYVNPVNGYFSMQNTQKLATGTYVVSVKCTSDGILYDFPEAITVKIVKER